MTKPGGSGRAHGEVLPDIMTEDDVRRIVREEIRKVLDAAKRAQEKQRDEAFRWQQEAEMRFFEDEYRYGVGE